MDGRYCTSCNRSWVITSQSKHTNPAMTTRSFSLSYDNRNDSWENFDAHMLYVFTHEMLMDRAWVQRNAVLVVPELDEEVNYYEDLDDVDDYFKAYSTRWAELQANEARWKERGFPSLSRHTDNKPKHQNRVKKTKTTFKPFTHHS